MDTIKAIFILVLSIISYIVIFGILLALPVMLLWNWVIPDIFVGLKPIDFWHALGLSLLSSCFFGWGNAKNNKK